MQNRGSQRYVFKSTAEPWIQIAWILVLKALALGQWASRSWLWRSLIALFLPLAGVFRVPTLGIELCALAFAKGILDASR